VPNVQIGTERDLALRVGNFGRAATLENALSRSAAFYFSKEEARIEIERLKSIVSSWKKHFISSGFNGEQAEGFATCFTALKQTY
jgi:serine/threonine-protein kinase HipA